MKFRLQMVPAGTGRIYTPRYHVPRYDTTEEATHERGFAWITFSYVLMALLGVVTLPGTGQVVCAVFLMAYALRTALRCVTIRPTNIFS